MNDVKLNNVDVAARQGSQASSSPPDPVRRAQESSAQPDQVRQQEIRELRQRELEEQANASQDTVQDAVTKLNDYVQSVQRDLRFQLDDDSGKTIITVVDSRTSEVVRQIPDDVALKLARDLQQDEPLSLFNAKV
ncbi:MAG: flagellar protein FlaG [Reinekea sp.]|nr:flagellar protein FlaG [Reinekea sp.]